MLTVTVKVNAPLNQSQGIKESLSMWLEQYGDARVVCVTEDVPEQLKIQN